MLIGRLTRDPEVRTFGGGGKVAKLGFAVSGKKKDRNTGQFVDDPVFLDVEVFNKGDYGKLADLAEQYLVKGKQVYIEGRLRLDRWQDKDGGNRQKLVVVADNIQFLDKKEDGGGGDGGGNGGRSSYQGRGRGDRDAQGYEDEGGGEDSSIPF
jgi:single-strand DNA-binding protein